jgi:2'-5' RNA ligase
MRTFIAIPISEVIKSKLTETQKELKTGIKGGISWVDPSLTHITLKFLGDIDESYVPSLIKGLQNAIHEVQCFDTTCGGLGCFPNAHQPRVIWLGVKKDLRLIELQKLTENVCTLLGFPEEEKKFSPHLTLGRVKGNLMPAELMFLDGRIKSEANSSSLIMPVTKIVLFKSQLARTGPTYHPLSIVELENNTN